jgi:hypothetical protein
MMRKRKGHPLGKGAYPGRLFSTQALALLCANYEKLFKLGFAESAAVEDALERLAIQSRRPCQKDFYLANSIMLERRESYIRRYGILAGEMATGSAARSGGRALRIASNCLSCRRRARDFGTIPLGISQPSVSSKTNGIPLPTPVDKLFSLL